MKALIYKFCYFLKRDIAIWLSYRVQLVLGFLSGFVGIIQFGLIGKFIAGGNYFPMIEKYVSNGGIVLIADSLYNKESTIGMLLGILKSQV